MAITLVCDFCGAEFSRRESEHNKCVRRGCKKFYCSKKCHQENSKAKTVKCSVCGVDTRNPKFCSRSCAAVYNGKAVPKRKKIQKKCVVCGVDVVNRNRYCKDHRPKRPYNNSKGSDRMKMETVGSRRLDRVGDQYPSIRAHARRRAREFGILNECYVCGYTLYIECCHRTPISDFPGDTLIDVVNSRDNLVGLCPNHHWEFDNGFLEL
jgi:hypothetical protein